MPCSDTCNANIKQTWNIKNTNSIKPYMILYSPWIRTGKQLPGHGPGNWPVHMDIDIDIDLYMDPSEYRLFLWHDTCWFYRKYVHLSCSYEFKLKNIAQVCTYHGFEAREDQSLEYLLPQQIIFSKTFIFVEIWQNLTFKYNLVTGTNIMRKGWLQEK